MRYELVVVGASLGGLYALKILLAGLPVHFCLPIVIVQHRSRESDDTLRSLLQQSCTLPVEEVLDKATMLPGRVYLAPSNYHLLIEQGSFALSTEAPVGYSRPSIDVLFESAAMSYGSSVIGIILTGANSDGAYGACLIKKRGGFIIVQDPASAEVRVMPDATIAATPVDQVLELSEISQYLVMLCEQHK